MLLESQARLRGAKKNRTGAVLLAWVFLDRLIPQPTPRDITVHNPQWRRKSTARGTTLTPQSAFFKASKAQKEKRARQQEPRPDSPAPFVQRGCRHAERWRPVWPPPPPPGIGRKIAGPGVWLRRAESGNRAEAYAGFRFSCWWNCTISPVVPPTDFDPVFLCRGNADEKRVDRCFPKSLK